MRLLPDTNIFFEVLLGQEKSEDVKRLLTTRGRQFYITDFSLHSIGVLLFRKKQSDVLDEFAVNIVGGAGMEMLTIPIDGMGHVTENAARFNLDFDDAFQYSVS